MLFLTHPVAVFTSDLRRLDSECLFFFFFILPECILSIIKDLFPILYF